MFLLFLLSTGFVYRKLKILQHFSPLSGMDVSSFSLIYTSIKLNTQPIHTVHHLTVFYYLKTCAHVSKSNCFLFFSYLFLSIGKCIIGLFKHFEIRLSFHEYNQFEWLQTFVRFVSDFLSSKWHLISLKNPCTCTIALNEAEAFISCCPNTHIHTDTTEPLEQQFCNLIFFVKQSLLLLFYSWEMIRKSYSLSGLSSIPKWILKCS